MPHPTQDGWCDCQPPEVMTEAARTGADFAALMLGGSVCYGPPPPDSMLAWALAQPDLTAEAIRQEWARRGTAIHVGEP